MNNMAKLSSTLPAFVWERESFQRCLSLRDYHSLSMTCKDWRDAVMALSSRPQARKLLAALTSLIPSLAEELTRRQLTILDTDEPARVLKQFRLVVAFLQRPARWEKWELAVVAIPGLLTDLSRIVVVPHVSEYAAEHFVRQLNMHIRYKQLLLAAYSGVAGVEKWVQVQHELGIETDIPEIAVVACLEDIGVDSLEQHARSSEGSLDILWILLNRRPAAAIDHIVAMLLSRIKREATLVHMLQMAIARKHNRVLQTAMNLCRPLLQQLKPATVLQLMQADVAMSTPFDYMTLLFRGDSAMRWLTALPAAASLPLDELKPLMHFALNKSCYADQQIAAICSLPEAQQLAQGDISRMMKHAADRSLDAAIIALCRLPAARSMTVEAWFAISLSAAAVLPRKSGPAHQATPNTSVQELCKLPAAQGASPAMVAELLVTALKFEGYNAAAALCALPAAQDIPCEQVIALVQRVFIKLTGLYDEYTEFYENQAVRFGSNALTAMTRLDAVQSMGAAQLLELLDILVWDGNYQPGVDWLSSLPAAHSIPARVMGQQLQAAVQQLNSAKLQALCRFPAARHINAETMVMLFADACKSDGDVSRAIRLELCTLAATRQAAQLQFADASSAMHCDFE